MTDSPLSIAALIALFPTGNAPFVTTASQRSFIQTLALRTPMLNVADPLYRIDVTGATDATAAYGALLGGAPAGSVIYHPPGSIVLFSTVSIPSGITILGPGTLRQKTGTNGNGLTNSGAVSNIIIDGPVLDANSNVAGFGQGIVWFSGVTNCVVKNCVLMRGAQMGCDTSIRVRFVGNSGTGLGAAAASIDGVILFTNSCLDCEMTLNSFDTIGGNGLTINDTATSSLRCKIMGNTLTAFGRIGIEITTQLSIQSPANHSVIGNVLKTASSGASSGISLAPNTDGICTGNYVEVPLTTTYGIEVIGKRAVVSGNKVLGAITGIFINSTNVGDVRGAVVEGNSIVNPATYGMQFFNSVDKVGVRGNYIEITNGAQIGINTNPDSEGGTAVCAHNDISHNTIYIASTDAADGVAGIITGGRDTLVEGNQIILNLAADHGSSGAIQLIGTRNTARGNYMEEISGSNRGSGIFSNGTRCDYCIGIGNRIVGFGTGGAMDTNSAFSGTSMERNTYDNCTNRENSQYNRPPSTGTFQGSYFVANEYPTEAGAAASKYVEIGSICVSGGTPGTWVPVRTLTGN